MESNNYQMMICEDCSYPPNFVSVVKPGDAGETLRCITCRDCGDYWEEVETPGPSA